MQRIIPHLWFDDQAEEAVKFYTSIFPDARIGRTMRYDTASANVAGRPEGSVLTIDFELAGSRFIALNGGPLFTFNPSISFMVRCRSKDEVDRLWEALSDGGSVLMELDTYPFSERYGWLADRYGVTWQLILPSEAPTLSISPSLLFVGDKAGRAEEAIEHYTSVFDSSRIVDIARYPEGSEPDEAGTIAYASFELLGEELLAMDSALEHAFTFNEAISLMVRCESQEEIDRYWEALSAVPESEQCGWLKDRYGVSWQIVPRGLEELIGDSDPARSARAMEAMLQMKKLDIAALKNAADRHE